ncbi:MAG: phosphoenolpyruvate hydrolase family protein [Propionibacteriaceae bacterium]|nr:phosphoenolpyruvate hydrolase family protein [Propionibacteriaceae bacterium]
MTEAQASNSPRVQVRARMDAKVASGSPVLLCGAPNGQIAKAAASAGADAVMVYNVAAFRSQGHSSLLGYLPYGDANGITQGLAAAVLPACGKTPLIAGVGAADPLRSHGEIIQHLLEVGVSGVVNTPTAGVYDGDFRRELESQGIGYAREVEFMRAAADAGLFTVAYAFCPDDARQLADAGTDMVVVHLGTTGAGSGGLDGAVARTEEIAGAVAGSNALVVLHGGPLEDPGSVAYVLERTATVGFLAGSGIDRIPVVKAVQNAVSEFTALRLRTAGAR